MLDGSGCRIKGGRPGTLTWSRLLAGPLSRSRLSWLDDADVAAFWIKLGILHNLHAASEFEIVHRFLGKLLANPQSSVRCPAPFIMMPKQLDRSLGMQEMLENAKDLLSPCFRDQAGTHMHHSNFRLDVTSKSGTEQRDFLHAWPSSDQPSGAKLHSCIRQWQHGVGVQLISGQHLQVKHCQHFCVWNPCKIKQG